MAEQRMVGIRIPAEIEERLKALTERLSSQTLPGIRLTFSDVARAALVRGLDVLEGETARKKKPR